MAVSSVLPPGPQLGPAPAVPAGNFTRIANDLTREAMPHHEPAPAPPPSQRHQAAPNAGHAAGAHAGHKVDHKA